MCMFFWAIPAGSLLIAIIGLALFIFIVDISNGMLVSSGKKRYYLLHVPTGIDPSAKVPLVVALHGGAEWPALSSWINKWNQVAEEEGFIVVHPSGVWLPKQWRTHGAMRGPTNPEIDIRFIADLINHLKTRFNIDPLRVFVSGFSNGGGLAYLLSCYLSDAVAAVGGISGAYFIPLDQCPHSHPVPLILFHGTADKVVPYHGGPSGKYVIPFPDIPRWIEDYARLNGCHTRPAPAERSLNPEVTCLRYSGEASSSEVILYTIHGGGHSWPGGNPLPGWLVGKTSQAIDATRTLWQFFQNHPLAAEKNPANPQ